MTSKLAVFDFDSTLMDGETLEFFARELGIEEKVRAITDKENRSGFNPTKSGLTLTRIRTAHYFAYGFCPLPPEMGTHTTII